MVTVAFRSNFPVAVVQLWIVRHHHAYDTRHHQSERVGQPRKLVNPDLQQFKRQPPFCSEAQRLWLDYQFRTRRREVCVRIFPRIASVSFWFDMDCIFPLWDVQLNQGERRLARLGLIFL